MRAVAAGLAACTRSKQSRMQQHWGCSFLQHEQPPKLFTTNLPFGA
jgi:hypothetical protein